MDISSGNQALKLKAEALMLQALILLDEADAGLPAVHLQSALDMLERHKPRLLTQRPRLASATPR